MQVAIVLAILGPACTPEGTWAPRQRKSPTPLAPAEDIFKVVCLYPPNMWQSFDRDSDPDPEGFKFNLFLLSRKTNKGVHTTGMLQTRMFCWNALPDGTRQRKEVCAWTQDLADVPRSAKPYQLGWVYQPHFEWGDADVLGQEVDIVTWYEAPDGRQIRAQTMTVKVPARK